MNMLRTARVYVSDFFLPKSRNEMVLFFSSFLVKLLFIGLIISTYGLTQIPWQPDSDGYLPLADSIYYNHAFTYSVLTPFIPEADHSPGYPFFLAFTASPFRSVVPAIFIQSVLFSVSVMLLFRLASAYVPRRVAFFGALLYGVEPYTSFIVAYPLSESLFLFLIIASLYFFNKAIEFPGTLLTSLVGGTLLGVAALVRPIGLYLIPLLFVVGCVLLLHRKMGWKVLVVGFLACMFPLLLWAGRNAEQFGVWTVASKGPHTVYFYYVEQLLEYREGWTDTQAVEYLFNRLQEKYPELTSIADVRSPVYSAYLKNQSLEIISESPLLYAKLHMFSVGTFFLSDGYRMLAQSLGIPIGPMPNITKSLALGHWATVGNYFTQFPLSLCLFLLGFMFWFLITSLAFGAFVLTWFKTEKTSTRFFIVFLFLMMLAFAVMTGPVAQPRYRIVITPFLFILAGYSVHEISRRLRVSGQQS